MSKPLIVYLAAVNIMTLMMFALDKHKAIKGKHRISERTLLVFSFLGGAFLGLLSMYVFRHKTSKPKFIVLLPLSFLLWSLVLMYVLKKGMII